MSVYMTNYFDKFDIRHAYKDRFLKMEKFHQIDRVTSCTSPYRKK